MPSILSDDDKETVKRFVPKQTNKIQAVAVARLYVAYPNPARWTNTGIQGAIVLSNDLVGNTYWLKMVDISSGNRGVIWDQEIFDTWSYNQDRTYFHSFEIEECLAGLSFTDEKEAKQFKKKMDDREKNASRATRSTPFGGASQAAAHKHGLLGGLFGGRHAAAPTPPDSPRSNLPHGRMPSLNGGHKSSEFAVLDAFDPQWRENFGQDLRDKGLTDEFIKENQEFIVEFLKEEQEKLMAGARSHARRGACTPACQKIWKSRHACCQQRTDTPKRASSARSIEDKPWATSSAATTQNANARGRKACWTQIWCTARICRGQAGPATSESRTCSTAAAPTFGWPATPSESSGVRGTAVTTPVFTPGATTPGAWQSAAASSPTTVAIIECSPTATSPNIECSSTATSPDIECSSAAAIAVLQCPSGTSSASVEQCAACASSAASRSRSTSSTAATSTTGRLGRTSPTTSYAQPRLWKAGGIRALKKVDRSQIRDRSSATVGGGSDSGPHGSGLPPAGVAPGGGGGGDMANALAAALQKRKEKVSRSDDERSDNDDW
ncbi:hypothetical protein HER10_EVM0011930 [Colletotrichum scovillei]|uniref:uncharacterized protein n=1 Tax=Colletotrichum scovillei TaxID=1209932 RepID=UPI0015C2D0E2|nr:uncharacterized protein HER10_EVM0011930 [Colletotrichum scovillei]KAF4780434.1 hypothetical protein HER10_EVM0011930 [Colletotrichum scovillei]